MFGKSNFRNGFPIKVAPFSLSALCIDFPTMSLALPSTSPLAWLIVAALSFHCTLLIRLYC